MNYHLRKTSWVLLLFFVSNAVPAQQQKQVNRQTQVWLSINNSVTLKGKLGLIADVHVRRNHFLKDDGFYFIRGGFSCRISNNCSVVAGYGHMWLAPSTPGYSTFADENRIYQQVQFTTKHHHISLLQRLRNEQRWQEIVIDDKSTHQNKFSNRIRYLASITIPMPRHLPAIVVANELCVQFGKQVVYHTFDQNRLFIGIKQPVTSQLSFDIGYMKVFQQKASGWQYDLNHTFRCFFYYNRGQ